MIKSEFADVMAPGLPRRRSVGGVTQSGAVVNNFLCSTMGKSESVSAMRKSLSTAAEPVCGKLRILFDDVASEPMPDNLASLCDKLDSAFVRGELFAARPKPKGSGR